MDASMRIPVTATISILVDDQDIPLVVNRKWSTFQAKNGMYYINTHINGRTVYLHRLILNAPEGMEVDHISRDTLDNRRCNLRLVTHQQNLHNADWKRRRSATGYRGVSKLRDGPRGHRTKRYVAQVGYLGKHITGGVYKTAEEAAQAATLLREHAKRLADAGIQKWKPI